MSKYVIITAGGSGTRMNTDIPKQFLKLGRLPVLMHTVNRFYFFDKNINIIISLPEEFIEHWTRLCREYKFIIKHRIVSGGKTRFHSVKNALDVISGEGTVAVHDGVRPLVSSNTIAAAFETAEKKGNAVACCDIVFSLRKTDENNNFAVNRDVYKEIQTPQVFNLKGLKRAYESGYKDWFTDDASVFENAGNKIFLVKGNRENIKITNREDLIIAEALLDTVF